MQKGISTIEVVFSIFLVSVALIVYAASLNLVPLSRNAKYENIAYHLALKQIEQLRNTDFSSLPPSGPIVDADLSFLPQATAQLTMVDVDTTLKHVTVDVVWEESRGSKSVSLDTYIYASGLNSL